MAEVPRVCQEIHLQDSTSIEELSSVDRIGGRLTPALRYPLAQAPRQVAPAGQEDYVAWTEVGCICAVSSLAVHLICLVCSRLPKSTYLDLNSR